MDDAKVMFIAAEEIDSYGGSAPSSCFFLRRVAARIGWLFALTSMLAWSPVAGAAPPLLLVVERSSGAAQCPDANELGERVRAILGRSAHEAEARRNYLGDQITDGRPSIGEPVRGHP